MNVIESKSSIENARGRDVSWERDGGSALILVDDDGSEQGFDLKFYWRLMVRSRWTIIATTVAMLIVGAVITVASTKVYEASTSLQIERESTRVLNVQEVQPPEVAQEAERFLQTQVDLIGSRSQAMRVAETLGFFSRPQQFFERMNEKPPAEGGSAQALREQIIEILRDNTTVDWRRNSRIVNIVFASPDPGLASQVANAMAETYIAGNLERKFESSSYAREFLERRLAQIKPRLEQSERALIGYARHARLIDASSGAQGSEAGPKSLTASSLVHLNSAYSDVRSRRIQLEERWRQANSERLLNLPEVLANPAVQSLIQKRAEVRAELQDSAKMFQGDYPNIKRLRAQIGELDGQINAAALSIRGSIRNQYETAMRQEEALKIDVDRLKSSTLSEQGRSIQYNILQREVDTNRALYDAMLSRYKEISVSGGVTANNISVVDQAEPPINPSRPRPLLNLCLAGIFGIALGLAIAYLRDRFDDTVRNPAELKQKLGLPLIGLIPAAEKTSAVKEQIEDSRSDLSESYSSVRSSLQFASSAGVPSPLLVTSSQQSEGKSTSSMAIAMSFARIGKAVLLVDCDLRRPSLHANLSLSREIGLSNVLSGQALSSQVIQDTGRPNLAFMATGPLPIDPTELLSSQRFSDVLADLSETFDLVILDGPPVMGLADAPLIGAVAAGTVLVLEAGKTHRGQSKIAMDRLRHANANLIGVLLTKFAGGQSGYGSDYTNAYRYDYGSEKVAG